NRYRFIFRQVYNTLPERIRRPASAILRDYGHLLPVMVQQPNVRREKKGKRIPRCPKATCGLLMTANGYDEQRERLTYTSKSRDQSLELKVQRYKPNPAPNHTPTHEIKV
ncbi:MAG: hypothetical protein D6675_13150, partial [Gemmatimonadetes bacterium]